MSLLAGQTIVAATVMHSAPLQLTNGEPVGAAFSRKGGLLAVITCAASDGTREQYVLQTIDLNSQRILAHTDISEAIDSDQPGNAQFIDYSADGRYLVVASRGSDVLSIIDANSLRILKRVALNPRANSILTTGQAHRYFRGIISLATSSHADMLAALIHAETSDDEICFVSFSSAKVTNRWTLGKERASTQLGQISVSLNEDGSRTAVSALPDGDKVPRTFANIRLYDSSDGKLVQSIRTTSLIGQIFLLSDNTILTSRVDTPGLFSKKTCIEQWSFGSERLIRQFCDDGRNVGVTVGSSSTMDRIVGFAFQVHKSLEGQLYGASGRVDVWSSEGNLIAFSDEIPHFISSVKMSADGDWVWADTELYRVSAAE